MVQAGAVPAVSVGNLTVGGTGKTPVAAWMAAALLGRGARPAIILRGYGSDEPQVHALLNPGLRVIADPDRVRAVRAAQEAGCDVAVLDDAFQHRRAARVEDVVLVSSDRWQEQQRPLPAGPWREPIRSLDRATLLLITRRAASRESARALLARLAPCTSTATGAVVALMPGPIMDFRTGAELPLEGLRGERVLVVAGVGDPRSLADQIRQAGARVALLPFPDHHRYSPGDVSRIRSAATAHDRTICTLKDAVKLAPVWPRQAEPLWYVSLRCVVEDGEAAVSALLDRLMAARLSTTLAGARRPLT